MQDLPQELVKGPLHLVSTRTPERADNNKGNLPPNDDNAPPSPRKEGGKMTTRLDPELHDWEDVFRQPQGCGDHRGASNKKPRVFVLEPLHLESVVCDTMFLEK